MRIRVLLLAAAAANIGGAAVVSGKLSINGQPSGDFAVGAAWSLKLESAPEDMRFRICVRKDAGPTSCTQEYGPTAADGSWTMSAFFDQSTVGTWTEWAEFPNGSASSRVSFTVQAPKTGSLTINTQTGAVFAPGAPWTLRFAGGLPNTRFDLCAYRDKGGASCSRNFGTTDQSGGWTLAGAFNKGDEGGWTEWLEFPDGAKSGTLTFSVGDVVSYRLYGIDFGPFLNGEDPTTGLALSDEVLEERVARIAPFTRWIRTYGSTNNLAHICAFAHKYATKCAIGIWLNNNSAANETELAAGIAAARSGGADMVIVGSEALYRRELSESQLVAYIERVKQALASNSTMVVTTGEPFEIWMSNPALADAAHIIFVNHYPYWNGDKIDIAVGRFNQDIELLKSRYSSRFVWVGETGWPSGGQTIREAVSSPQNSAAYFLNFVSWARAKSQQYFYFEAYDESWKVRQEGPQGGLWGVLDSSGNLKPGMADVFAGKTVADNWTMLGPAIPGGPGIASIRITSVPARVNPTSSQVQGEALHVVPADHYVAVYIRVRGGWWTKPYWDSPKTMIRPDGSWTCSIFTGGVDGEADQIAAYLMPASFSIVPLAAGGTIPPTVESNAVAKATASR